MALVVLELELINETNTSGHFWASKSGFSYIIIFLKQ